MEGRRSPTPPRSRSMPTTSHPIDAKAGASLDHLHALSATPCSSAKPVSAGLNVLSSLCTAVDELIRLPTSQLVLVRSPRVIDEAMDGYVRLLDACNAARDALLLTKDHAQAVHSAFRRRGAEAGVVLPYINEYIRARGNAKKIVASSLKALKPQGRCKRITAAAKVDRDLVSLSDQLRQNRDAACAVLSSLLRLLDPTPSRKISSKWVSLLLLPRNNLKLTLGTVGERHCRDGWLTASEVYLADAAIARFRQGKHSDDSKLDAVSAAQERLGTLEARLEELESALQRVYLGLIRNRVTLLNVVSN